MGKEDLLNLAFANKLTESRDFSSWVLGQTKFSEYSARVQLLDKEQALARTPGEILVETLVVQCAGVKQGVRNRYFYGL